MYKQDRDTDTYKHDWINTLPKGRAKKTDRNCPTWIWQNLKMSYITNITNKSEVNMDLLLIITLSLLFWLGLLILNSMAKIIHRSEIVQKRFDK